MTIRFEYTVQDFVEAQRAHGQRVAGAGAMTMLVIIPLAVGVSIWFALTLLGRAGGAYGLWGYAAVILPWIVFWTALIVVLRLMQRKAGPKAVAAGTPALKGPMTAEVDAGGVAISSAIWRVQYAWPAVIGFTETKDLFLLSITPVSSHAIPKRGFASREEVDAFRNLAQRMTNPNAPPIPVTREPATNPS